MSLNSSAFSVLEGDNNFLGSLYKTKDNEKKLLSRKDRSVIELYELDYVNLKFLENHKFEGEYHQIERDKIVSFIERADIFFEMLKPHLREGSFVFMEGISFGSKGNSLIDICMLTSLLRERIISVIDPKNFYVFSPSSIKKFAGKGNFKKHELYESILLKEDSRIEKIKEVLNRNKHQWIKGSKDVVSPCNDLIDAIWISLFGEDFLQSKK